MSTLLKTLFAPLRAASLSCLVLCLGLAQPFSARAAALADEQTVLYYLVEMQRQHVKICNGVPMGGEARSLLPSESLRTLAGMAASSGRPLSELLEAHGLAGAAVFQATAKGDSPQRVFAGILAKDCAALMLPAYRYIGASNAEGAWTLLMADREPVFGASAPKAGSSGPALPSARPQDGVVPLEDQPLDPVAPEPAARRPEDPRLTGEPPSSPQESLLASPAPLPEIQAAPAQPSALSSGSAAPASSGTAPPSSVSPVAAPPSPASSGAVSSSALAPAPPASVSPEPAAHPSTRPVRVAGAFSAEDLLPLINEARARGRRCGGELLPPSPPLVHNPVLTEVAEAQIQDMIRGGYFASTRPDGKTLGMRLSETGYAWDDAAESIASVSPPASRAVAAWLNQESQCRALLSPAYTEAGAAFDGRRNYWVFTLTRPLPEGSEAVRLK
ncbi:MAG: CAP domain-containing protein [Deltaproteobacteria bacterium]|jgi:uncharacterized protein YkwD|nr:CAP domain-containing protein [Deltaproteobacteria bacterium]